MENIWAILDNYITKISLPRIGIIDIIEILLISVFVYQFMLWIKNTRAYTLMKGILVVLAFIFIAYEKEFTFLACTLSCYGWRSGVCPWRKCCCSLCPTSWR